MGFGVGSAYIFLVSHTVVGMLVFFLFIFPPSSFSPFSSCRIGLVTIKDILVPFPHFTLDLTCSFSLNTNHLNEIVDKDKKEFLHYMFQENRNSYTIH